MSDLIRLRGIRAEGRHGVLASEKHRVQPFLVDLDVTLDVLPAATSDDLADTVNYAQLAAAVVAVIRGPSVDLIEHLAARIAAECLDHPLVEAVEVTVHKPQAPVGVPVTDVAVRIRREHSRPVVIALGANLGRPLRTLSAAVAALGRLDGLRVRVVSDVFDTDPVGGPDPEGQPRYLNAVLLGETRLHPATLLRRLHELEAGHGRLRAVPWGPRTLDLDLVQFGDPTDGQDLRSEDPALLLPHPRAHERLFVLVPWLDADPAAVLRVADAVVPVAQLVADLGDPAAGGPPPVRPGPAWSSAGGPVW